MIKYLLCPIALLALSFNASARECHLAKDGKSGTLTISGTSYESPLVFHYVSDDVTSTIHELTYFDPTLYPDLWTYCDGGDNGFGFYMNTNASSTTTGTDGRALYPTNVDGIYYAVKMYSSGGVGGYFTNMNNGSWVQVDSGSESQWTNQYMNATVTLYQTTGFRGNLNNVSVLKPKDSRTLGQIRVGTNDTADNNPWTVNVTPDSFSIPISAATCGSLSVNNGTNNVDFGEIMPSALRQNYWPNKTFTFQMKNCSNTVWMRFKLSSTSSTTNSQGYTLLTNTLSGSTAAQGIGVYVQANITTRDGENGFKPGLEIWSPMNSVSYSESFDLPFFSQIYRLTDGGELTMGNFKAIGTFTVDYF